MSFALLSLALCALPAQPVSSADEVGLHSSPRAVRLLPQVLLAASPTTVTQPWLETPLVGPEDAPWDRGSALLASGLTYLTGLVMLSVTGVGPATGLPGGTFALHARLLSGLLVASAGPRVGDLLNQDTVGFLGSGAGKFILGLVVYASTVAIINNPRGALAPLAGVALSLGGLGWFIWSSVDLARSYWSADRWAERENARRMREQTAPAPAR